MLALDTSSVACTVAVRVDGEVCLRHEERPREHTRLLLPMIREALRESGATLNELDAVVLGNGPGSFIGMRIATSVAQGLAHGAGIQIIPVSSLAAVAAEVFAATDAGEVVVAQDAHMNEVYLGHFGRDEHDLPLLISGERLHAQVAVAGLDAVGASGRIAAGYGWQRYPNLMAENSASIRTQSNVSYPNARYLLQLAKQRFAVLPKDIQPAYLRQKVAEKPSLLRQ